MGIQVHKLLSKDLISQTGVCAHCGSVPLKLKSGVWRCYKGYLSQRGSRNRETSISWSHGLTAGEAKSLREGKVCAICGADSGLTVDHCHTTQVIRGILCRRCNFGIGYFKDDPQKLKAALAYLER